MVILGLDLSTSITGATVLDKEGNTLLCESWDTRNKNKFPLLFHKAQFIRKNLFGLQYPITKIYIEQPFTFFNSGGSTAKTMATLQRFNGIVSWICYNDLNMIPEYITATQARKLCELKVPRGTKAKEIALQHFLDNGNKIEYTSHGNPKPGSYDRADSWIIAKAGYRLWKEGLKS